MGWMHFIEKFDRENIDGQHLRPPVLAILLESIEKEGLLNIFLSKICAIRYITVHPLVIHSCHQLFLRLM